jgi:hypothetical protein
MIIDSLSQVAVITVMARLTPFFQSDVDLEHTSTGYVFDPTQVNRSRRPPRTITGVPVTTGAVVV